MINKCKDTCAVNPVPVQGPDDFRRIEKYNRLRKYEMNLYTFAEKNTRWITSDYNKAETLVSTLQKNLTDRNITYPAQKLSQSRFGAEFKPMSPERANELESDPAILNWLEHCKTKIDDKYVHECEFQRQTLGELRIKREAKNNQNWWLTFQTEQFKEYCKILQDLVDKS